MIYFAQIIPVPIILTPDSFWWTLGKDFILPSAIAALAAFMIYYIFIKETKRDKEANKTKKQQESQDKLLYFSTLVHNVLQNSQQQKEHLNALIVSIKDDPISFHLMTQVPLYDHKRIVEIINLEDYLLSFANYFKTNRTNSILEFQKIISSIDYLYSTFTLLIDVQAKSQQFDHERKIRYAQLFQSAHEKLQLFLVIFERLDNKFSKDFFQCFATFSSKHQGKNSDIALYNFIFFQPFHAFFVNYILEKQPIRQEIFDFVAVCKDAISLYAQIEYANKELIADYSVDLKDITDSIDELNGISKRLLSTFLNPG